MSQDLLDVLADLGDLARNLKAQLTLPGVQDRPSYRAALAIGDGAAKAPDRSPADRLREAWAAIQTAAAAGDFTSLSPQVRGDAIWLLWDQTRRAAGYPALFDLLLGGIGARSSWLGRLIQAWVVDFDAEDSSMRAAAGVIVSRLAAAQTSQAMLWRRRHERFALFDPETGPRRVAAALLDLKSDSPLVEAGLDTPLVAASGFMKAVERAVLAELPSALTRRSDAAAKELLRHVCGFLAPAGRLRRDDPVSRGALADALVSPWRDGKGQDALRPDVLAFLRQHLGDPRFKPENWDRAAPETKNRVLAWQAQLTLEAFFDVIGESAAKGGAHATWAARRKFWAACLRRGWISDSWLALESNVRARVAGNRALHNTYAELSSGTSHNHAALLIRIDNLIFVEWNFTGGLRAWDRNDPGAPTLLHSAYSEQALKRTGIAFPPPSNRPDLAPLGQNGVTHDVYNIWQGRVAALLRQRTGHRLQPQEWM